MAGNHPFPVDPVLTGIAMAFRQRGMIADDVLPRVPVGGSEFKWYKFDFAEETTLPDTRVGRRTPPNQVEFGASEETGKTVDYGLDDTIPQRDIDAAVRIKIDPRRQAVESIMKLLELDREVRVANMVTNLNNYPAAQRVTLSGTGQFSDYTNSDPLSVLMNALDQPIMRPNIMVIGQSAWTVLRMHPKLVAAVNGNVATAGVVSREDLARKLEIDEILVGRALVNNARKGQTPSMARAWGKDIALHYRERVSAVSDTSVTYGFTAQYGDRVSGAWEDKDAGGLKGGVRVRSGEEVGEVICSPECGYLFKNAVN